MRHLRIFIINIVLCFLVFQNLLAEISKWAQYTDEIYTLVTLTAGISVWCIRGNFAIHKSNCPWLLGLVVFNIFGWCSTCLMDYRGVKISFLSFFLSNKFFGILIGIVLICEYTDFLKDFAESLKCVRPILGVLFLWRIAAIYFEGIPDIGGIELCAKTVFIVCLIFFDWRGKKDYIYIFLACVLLASTGKGKAYGAIIIILAIIIWVFDWHKKIKIQEIILGCVALSVLTWDKIYRYYIYGFEAGYPRAMLLRYGLKIAGQQFPLGTGWGTFGSHYAAEYYSPVYVELGWSSLRNVGIDYKNFLNDNFWPMIICENGFCGFMGIAILLVSIFLLIQKQYKFHKRLYAASVLGFSYMMVTTVESTAFAHPSTIVIALILGIAIANNVVRMNEDTFERHKL